MSDFDDLSAPLEDYLVGLAEGVREAQRALNEVNVPGPDGKQGVSYHMPKVDFELSLSLSFTSRPEVVRRYDSPIPARSRSAMVFRPRKGGNGRETSGEAETTIKGSFVAVPVNGGIPSPTMDVDLTKLGSRKIEIRIQLTSPSGVGTEGLEVHCNLEHEEADVHPGTALTDGVVITDKGVA